MKQPYISSKWKKTAILLKNPELASYIPESRKFGRRNLHAMLLKHGMVYIKPVHGMFGRGVMKAEVRTGENRIFRLYTSRGSRKYISYHTFYNAVKRKAKAKPYMIQKGIHLLKYRNRPFDIRLMVQKNPQKVWEATGIIGRLARPGRIVTNYHSGGTPKDVYVLLSPYLPKEKIKLYIGKLTNIGLQCAAQYERKSRRFNEIGLDFATDESFNPWILEVNTRPDPYIFRKLRDKSVFRKVYRYAKAYGRV
ncbi:MAG TPA: YheC/YheD family protein [Bacilli bacterium]